MESSEGQLQFIPNFSLLYFSLKINDMAHYKSLYVMQSPDNIYSAKILIPNTLTQFVSLYHTIALKINSIDMLFYYTLRS